MLLGLPFILATFLFGQETALGGQSYAGQSYASDAQCIEPLPNGRLLVWDLKSSTYKGLSAGEIAETLVIELTGVEGLGLSSIHGLPLGLMKEKLKDTEFHFCNSIELKLNGVSRKSAFWVRPVESALTDHPSVKIFLDLIQFNLLSVNSMRKPNSIFTLSAKDLLWHEVFDSFFNTDQFYVDTMIFAILRNVVVGSLKTAEVNSRFAQPYIELLKKSSVPSRISPELACSGCGGGATGAGGGGDFVDYLLLSNIIYSDLATIENDLRAKLSSQWRRLTISDFFAEVREDLATLGQAVSLEQVSR